MFRRQAYEGPPPAVPCPIVFPRPPGRLEADIALKDRGEDLAFGSPGPPSSLVQFDPATAVLNGACRVPSIAGGTKPYLAVA
jgi:hypothetical protein